jgi:excisionase family DNA binding protein
MNLDNKKEAGERNPMRRPPVRLLTVDEFASLTGWKPSTVRQKIWRRELPYVRLGRSIRLQQETFERLVATSTVPIAKSWIWQQAKESLAKVHVNPESLAKLITDGTMPVLQRSPRPQRRKTMKKR